MIKEAEGGDFELEYAGILVFVPRPLLRLSRSKRLISFLFLPSAVFVAGEFTVYKKGRIDPHYSLIR
jgi:hypothetical protein